MNPWVETGGVILVALLGILAGRAFSQLKKPYWGLGYLLPLVLVGMLALVRIDESLYFLAPFSWVTTGRIRFITLSLAVSMGLTVPLPRLPRRWEKLVVCFLMVGFIAWFSVLPFLVPALIRDQLSNLKTRFDSNGICRQTTDFTCGPAAAVTALGRLGLSGDEGELAVLSYSSPVVGTLPACLTSALQKRYGADGLKCSYRRFDSIEQLREAGITLVVVKDAFLLDHCVAVLDVSESGVTVADPVTGAEVVSYQRFEKMWRFAGIVLQRAPMQNI